MAVLTASPLAPATTAPDTLALVATECAAHGALVLEIAEDRDTLRVVALVRSGCGCFEVVEAARRRFLGF
jgi:hypothetical protein